MTTPSGSERLTEAQTAVISDCGRYRYRLERQIDAPDRVVAFIMVNPSTADASSDDPTIRKVVGFGRKMGAGRVIVGNLFAYRATDIKELRSVRDPIGPDNDDYLESILRDADRHIVAWGASAKLPEVLRKRWQDFVRIADRVGCNLECLGTVDDGHPRHPLMPAYDTVVAPWTVPWFAGRAALAQGEP